MQKPINFKDITIGAIPTSYLNSLTYEEQILCLMKAINEIINTTNEITNDLIEIKNTLEILNSKIENFEEYTDEEIAKLKNELINLMNNKYYDLKSYIDYNINELDEKITNITLADVNVRNPVNGRIENIQKVIDDIFYSYTNGITASRFDNLDLSADDYDNYEITAYEFDTNSNAIL